MKKRTPSSSAMSIHRSIRSRYILDDCSMSAFMPKGRSVTLLMSRKPSSVVVAVHVGHRHGLHDADGAGADAAATSSGLEHGYMAPQMIGRSTPTCRVNRVERGGICTLRRSKTDGNSDENDCGNRCANVLDWRSDSSLKYNSLYAHHKYSMTVFGLIGGRFSRCRAESSPVRCVARTARSLDDCGPEKKRGAGPELRARPAPPTVNSDSRLHERRAVFRVDYRDERVREHDVRGA